MSDYVYEIVNYSTGGDVMAKFWWDGKSVKSDNKNMLEKLKKKSIHGKTYRDGVEFLENLKYHYKNGYLMVRKVKK